MEEEERIERMKQDEERQAKIKALTAELGELQKVDQERKVQEDLEKNYHRFRGRPAGWVLGKAHFESGLDDRGYSRWNKNRLFSIYVEGNAGTSYKPEAKISSTTETFFHNVWTYNQQAVFQRKLTALAREEIEKIAHSPVCVIQMMGLADRTESSLQRTYPKERIPDVLKSVKEERFKILENFEVNELISLYYSNDISHGRGILREYLEWCFEKGKLGEIKFLCQSCKMKEIGFLNWIKRKSCDKCRLKRYEEEHNL